MVYIHLIFMPSQFDPVFLLSVAGTFVAFWVLTALYIWPAVRKLPTYQALKILTLPHAFRFMGLSFLFAGVVSPELPSMFSIPAAWGDVGAAILALLSIAALTWRWSFAIPLEWIFNPWGTIDLLFAFYNGIVLEIEPGLFGAAFYIPTMIVPPLLVIHALIFLILLRTEKTPAG
jgi:hypothetical protein